MRLEGFLLIVALMLALAVPFVDAAVCGGVTPCSCGDTVESSYTLTGNLSCSGAGLSIIQDNVVLNCAGFQINGTDTNTGIALGAGTDNATITNCVVKDFSYGFSSVENHSNILIENNTFTSHNISAFYIQNRTSTVGTYLIKSNNITFSTLHGADLDSAYNISFVNNTFSNHQSDGIELSLAHDTTLINNTFSGITTGSIDAIDSLRLLIQNNTITGSIVGIQVRDNGFAGTSSYNATIVNNTISSPTNYAIAITTSGVENTLISQNTITNGWDCIYVESNLQTISSNVLTTCGSTGVSTSLVAQHISITNNTVSSSGTGISLGVNYNNATNNTLHDNTHGISIVAANTTVVGNSVYNNTNGMRFQGGTNATLLRNNIFSNTKGYFFETQSHNNDAFHDILYSNTFDIDMPFDGGENFSVTNVSFDRDLVNVSEFSSLFAYWYLTVNVTNLTGSPLSSASVSVLNVSDVQVSSGFTNAQGLVNFTIQEFYSTNSLTTQMTPHNVSVTSGFSSSSTLNNFSQTNTTLLSFALNTSQVACGVVNQNVTLSSNLSSIGTCFTINASNITIDGAGFSLIGDGTGIGINITEQENVILKNLTIQNYATALLLSNATTGLLANSTIIDNNYGVRFLTHADGNTLFSNNFSNNSLIAVQINDSNGNTIYDNAFTNNSLHATDNSTNMWNITPTCGTDMNILGFSCIGGNYWGNYSGVDLSPKNGFGDTVHNISGGSNADAAALVSLCGTVLSSTTLPGSVTITTTGSCFTIAGGVTFDANGSTLRGDGDVGDIGVQFQGPDGFGIHNLHIDGFEKGLEGSGTTSLNTFSFSNLTITNVSIGFRSTHFHLATFNDSLINATNFSLSLYNTTNINFTNVTLVGSGGGIHQEFFDPISTSANFILGNVSVQGEQALVESGSFTFTNTSFPNTSYSFGVSSGAYVYQKWYALVNVTNGSGAVIPSASVLGRNVVNDLDDSQLTASDGISQLTLMEFYRTNNVTYYTTRNHTLSANKSGYTTNSTSVDLLNTTSSISATLVLDEVVCGKTLTANFSLGANLTTSGTCLTLGADNLVITGNGHVLTGTGNGIGIDASHVEGFSVSGLTLQNFTQAIDLTGVNTSTFSNLTLLNNTIGVNSNTSQATSFKNILFSGNTLDANVTNSGGTNISFVNSTINMSLVNVTGTAQVFLRWYVDVNATFSGTTVPLQGVNATGRDSSNNLDDSGLTGSTGFARLELAELKKNVTGIFYLTPHGVNASITISGITSSNQTSVNLSLVNNTQVNFGINASCSIPYDNFNAAGNVTLCPGTFTLDDTGQDGLIKVSSSNTHLTCSGQTTLVCSNSTYGMGIVSLGHNNVTISGCAVQACAQGGIRITNSAHSLLENLYITHLAGNATELNNVTLSVFNNITTHNVSTGIDLFGISNYNNITNNSLNVTQTVGPTGLGYGLSIAGSSFNTFHLNTLVSDSLGISLYLNSNSNNFTNNTLSVTDTALEMSNGQNNLFYHNNFTAGTTLVYNFVNSTRLNTTVNISGTLYMQGNEYVDYCDKGLDTNGDGYADAASSLGGDYPYNATTSTKFSGVGADYAPYVKDCVTVVQLGGSGGGGGSSSGSVAGSSLPAAPRSPAPKPAPQVQFYQASEVPKHLKVEKKSVQPQQNSVAVAVVLENTGQKSMKLLPSFDQTIADTLFIIDRKTRNTKGSLVRSLAGLSLSQEAIAGRLLEARVVDAQEIILKPGEKIEHTVRVEPGLIAPREFRMQFTSFGEVVSEQHVEIGKQAVTGVAFDVDQKTSVVDVYAVIVPSDGEQTVLSGTYNVELSFAREGKRRPLFLDLYGPYHINDARQAFVFAQQFSYDKAIYGNKGTFSFKLYRNGKVVAQENQEFKLK